MAGGPHLGGAADVDGNGLREERTVSPRAALRKWLMLSCARACSQQEYRPGTGSRCETVCNGYPTFFPLYHFFVSHHQHFIPYFFISRSDSLYILSYTPLQL
jgi:hypothetical protein